MMPMMLRKSARDSRVLPFYSGLSAEDLHHLLLVLSLDLHDGPNGRAGVEVFGSGLRGLGSQGCKGREVLGVREGL